MKQICPFCGQEKDTRHQALCPKNPNKRVLKSKLSNGDPDKVVPVGDLFKPKKEPWLSRAWAAVFHRSAKPTVEEVESPEKLIAGLKKYDIPDSNPKAGILGVLRRKKQYKQIVLVSKLYAPVTFWAELSEFDTRLLLHKNRAYKLPRDARGDVFFWDMDKKEPLVDSADATEGDAESSHHLFAVANQFYNLGKMSALGSFLEKINSISLLLLILIALVIINMIMTFQGFRSMGEGVGQINAMAQALNNSIHQTNGVVTIGKP